MKTDEIVQEATRKLRQHHRAPDEDRGILREVAELFVDLRERHLTAVGEPDWKGSTASYKAVVRHMFSEAGYDRAERDRAQAGIRYHVGNILRERLSPEELDYLGLHRNTPRERHSTQRNAQAALLASMRPTSDLDQSARVVEPLMGLTGAYGLLQRVQSEEVEELPPLAQRTFRRQMTAVGSEMKRLRAALRVAEARVV